MMRWHTGLAAAAVAAAAILGAATGHAEELNVTILHVNDAHGQLEGRINADGKSVGGYARLASFVQEVKGGVRGAKADRVFLVHAGDEFSKGDGLTRATRGQANVAVMNAVGFDFWVPGNGEFYDGVSNLQARMGEFKGKVLAANVTLKDTGRTLAEPWVIEELKAKEGVGPKIGFLGLCFVRMEHPAAKPLTLEDAQAAAARLVPEVAKQADVVIAVTHIGFDVDQKVAAKVRGLDAIIGGHTHTVVPKGHLTKDPDGRDVLICQTGEFLNNVGRLDLVLERTAAGKWAVREKHAELFELDETVKLDPKITAVIAREAAARQPATAPASQPAGVR